MDDAEQYVKKKEKEHKEHNDHLNKQVDNFIRMHGHLVSIEMPRQSPATSSLSLMAKLTKIVEKLIQARILTEPMKQQLAAIDTQRATCNTLWADVQLAQTAYEDAIDAYNAKAPPDEQVGTVEVPQPPDVAKLYVCPGPCSTEFTTQVLATTTHQVFCDIEPHKSQGYSYYSCPPDYRGCPTHEKLCRGGCGTEFELYGGKPNDVSHYRPCKERIPSSSLLRKTRPCPYRYYQCNPSNTCPNASNHVSDDGSSGSGSNPPNQGSTPPNTSPSDATPNCQDCTSDCSSPCSCSNSGTCGGTVVDNTPNCSGCTSHCSSPCSCTNSGTCNGTVKAPPPPPPPPKTKICDANGWTGCTIRSSDGEECYVDPCSYGCGVSYWSCNPNAAKNHTPTKECRRSGCGNTWQVCQKAPMCKAWSGNKCWAK